MKSTKVLSASFTRPGDTTAYASGDLVANSATAVQVVAMNLEVLDKLRGGVVTIRRVKLKKSGAVVTNAAFRVHFYAGNPLVPTNGDNGAWVSQEGGYLGSVDVTIDKAFVAGSAGHGAAAVNAPIVAQLAKGSKHIKALLEARGAYTPANAEVFTLTLEVEQENNE